MEEAMRMATSLMLETVHRFGGYSVSSEPHEFVCVFSDPKQVLCYAQPQPIAHVQVLPLPLVLSLVLPRALACPYLQPHPHPQALQWALAIQTQLLKLDWPPELLRLEDARPVMSDTGAIMFVGPKVHFIPYTYHPGHPSYTCYGHSHSARRGHVKPRPRRPCPGSSSQRFSFGRVPGIGCYVCRI